jgi:hypothetical protein
MGSYLMEHLIKLTNKKTSLVNIINGFLVK